MRIYHVIAVNRADFADYYVTAPTAVHAYRAVLPYVSGAREVWATLWPVPSDGVLLGHWSDMHGPIDWELHESWKRVQDTYQRMQ